MIVYDCPDVLHAGVTHFISVVKGVAVWEMGINWVLERLGDSLCDTFTVW